MSETNTGGQKVSNPSAKTLVPQPGPQSAPWQIPVAVPPPEYQWPAHFWPAAPWPQAYSQYMTAFLNPLPSVSQTSASNTPLASPRSKDDAVRLVKPKEPQTHPQPSPAEIQSPKPNSPGFSLGAFRKEGYHAFSPYNSRSDTPNRVSNTQTGTPSPAHMGVDKSGVDLTVSKSSSKTSEEKASNSSDNRKDDGRKSTIPVGIAVGRQRSPTANIQSKTGSKIVSEVKSAESVTNSTALVLPTNSVIASAETTTVAHQANSTSMSSQWSPFTVPYMANPYHHFTIAHPAMYAMVPAGPRGLFPAQPGIAPGYIPLPVIPELTVKTGQTSQTAHASTSPNKPVSTSCSPKSPLDKARERLHEMKQKKESEASSAQGKSFVSEVNQSNILKPAASSPETTASVNASLHMANNQKPEPKPSQSEDESYSLQKNKTQQPKSKNQIDEQKIKRPRGRPKGSVPKDKSSAKTPPLLKDTSDTHSSAAASDTTVQSVKSKKEKTSVAKRRKRSETPVQELCEVPKALAIPANIEKQPFLFAEDSLDPVIVKFDSKAYDICQVPEDGQLCDLQPEITFDEVAPEILQNNEPNTWLI